MKTKDDFDLLNKVTAGMETEEVLTIAQVIKQTKKRPIKKQSGKSLKKWLCDYNEDAKREQMEH